MCSVAEVMVPLKTRENAGIPINSLAARVTFRDCAIQHRAPVVPPGGAFAFGVGDIVWGLRKFTLAGPNSPRAYPQGRHHRATEEDC